MLMLSIYRNTRQLLLIVLAIIALGSLLLVTPARAQTDSSIAQGFKSQDANIAATSLVAIKRGNTNTVELSSIESADRLVGVVGAKPLIELSGGAGSVQVVTSGLTSAIVSDINGGIVNGDKITTSPIEGVGMKATQSTVVVGIAQGDLNSVSIEEQTITTKDGKEQTVKVGILPVQVGVAYYTIGSGSKSFVPNALQEVVNSIAGRNVSPIRVLVAGLILMLLFVSVTVLLYSAIRSGLISIGRNPLSEGAVRKSLSGVGRTLIVVFVFTIFIVYLVLAI